VVDGLDVVSVRVERVRRVVAGVVAPLAGRSVVSSPGREHSFVKAVHRFRVGRLKREMDARRRFAVRRDEELVGGEESGALHGDRAANRLERSRVERPARLKVAHPEVNVVEQPALVEEHLVRSLAL